MVLGKESVITHNPGFLCTVKVLILHQHFRTPYHGGAIRSWYLGQALVERNHQVVIIGSHSERRYRRETIDGMEVHFLPVPYDNRFGFFRRSLAFIQYLIRAVRLAGTLKNVDLCYAMSVPLTVGLAAWRIQRRWNIPFVFEVGDLWPDAPVDMGIVKNPLLKRWLFSLERKIYRSASGLVALSPAIRQSMETKSGRSDIEVVTNFADTEYFSSAGKDNTLEQRFGVEGKFVVSYIGAIGLANGLEHFVACAKSAQDAQLPLHFFLCGDGAMLETMVRLAEEEKLHNFSVVPFQTRDGIRDILNITDAVFISYKPFPILETGSPNKFFDGLAAGKLIIVNFGGWIAHEIESNRCGFRVDVNDSASFTSGIRGFVDNEALLKAFQRNARALAETRYSRRIMGERFVTHLESVMDDTRPGNF